MRYHLCFPLARTCALYPFHFALTSEQHVCCDIRRFSFEERREADEEGKGDA
jgi:hypothetical protein